VIAVGRSQDPSALMVSACTTFVLKCCTRGRAHGADPTDVEHLFCSQIERREIRHPTQDRFGLDGRVM
jgi:hypothetical protein